jgi:hypothetical protein
LPITIHNNGIAKRSFIPLLAFIIPVLVRAIPEVLAGQYILGFDTISYYVPNTIIWQHGGISLWNYLAIAPFFYTILISVTSAGVPILIALKIIPTLLLGFLGLSIYFYAHKGLSWSNIKSLSPALLGTLYFVSLRVSWDMLRNELGLIFFFIFLTTLTNTKNNSWKRYLLLSLTMMAVVLSHQLVSVIMLGCTLFTIVYRIIRKEKAGLIKLSVASLPSILFSCVVYFVSVIPSGFQDYSTTSSSLANWLGFSSYGSMVISEFGFFLYCFLPLLPLVFLSLRGFDNFQLRTWLLLTLLLVLIPFAFVSPFRWLLMLTYPLAFYVTDALSTLRRIRWKKLRISIFRLAITYLIVSTAIFSIGYAIEPTDRPFFYYDPNVVNSYIYQIPSSMHQNTISISDCNDAENVIQYFKNNTTTNAILLTHTVFYGWALTRVNSSQVINYGFADPVDAAMATCSGNSSLIYLIWWLPDHGWYGTPTLPSSFQLSYQSGNLALYAYEP